MRQALTTGWADWAVTDGDVRQVHEALQRLNPAAYRSTVERLESDGLLRSYVDPLSPDARAAFLSQAREKGLVRQSEAKPDPGSFNPPERPAFYVNDASLPPSVRAAAHQDALMKLGSYYRDYDEYLSRYSEGAEEASSLDALKALGEPKLPQSLFEPGVQAGHPDYETFHHDFVQSGRVSSRAYRAVADRRAELEGRLPAGKLTLKLDLEGKVGTLVGGLAATSPGELSARVGSQRGPLKLTIDDEGQALVEAEAAVGPFSATLKSDGELELALRAYKSSRGELAGTAFYNPQTAEYGGGLRATFKPLDDVELRANVRAGFKGLTPQAAQDAVDLRKKPFFDR